MWKMKGLTKKLVLPTAITITVFSIVGYYIGVGVTERLSNNTLYRLVDTKMADIQLVQKNVEDKLLSIASLFSKAEGVREAYKVAYQGDINDENSPQSQLAREMLRKYFTTISEGYTDVYNRPLRIHFHLPPARSLLRLWKKQTLSDDLRAFRNTVLTISRTHTPIKGVEIGQGGFVIRGIAPVFDEDGKYLGSVEVLSSYETLINQSVRPDVREIISVYMNKEYLDIATHLQNAEKHPIIGGEFVLVSSTDKELANSLIDVSMLNQAKLNSIMRRKGNYVAYLSPIKDFSGKQIGVMAYLYDASEIYGYFDKIGWGIGLFCLFLFLVVTTILTATARFKLVKPIAEASRIADAVANGDLNAKSEFSSDDEIGELSAALNKMCVNLREIVSHVKQDVDVITRGASELSSAANQLTEIADSTSSRSSVVATAAEEMSVNLNNMASSAEQMAENTKSVAASIEQMTVSIQEVFKNTDRAASIMEEATSLTEASNQKLSQLSSAADEIGKVVEVIQDIAEQTNLLALNATIEAARAGEAGKGFAVVANEIKELAKQTAEATGDIAKRIQAIQSSTREVVQAIGEITEVMGNVNEAAGTVKMTVKEQTQVAKEIAENISQVASASEVVSTNVNESAVASKEITQNIASVDQSAKRISENATVTQKAVNDLTTIAQELQEIVNKFKL